MWIYDKLTVWFGGARCSCFLSGTCADISYMHFTFRVDAMYYLLLLVVVRIKLDVHKFKGLMAFKLIRVS